MKKVPETSELSSMASMKRGQHTTSPDKDNDATAKRPHDEAPENATKGVGIKIAENRSKKTRLMNRQSIEPETPDTNKGDGSPLNPLLMHPGANIKEREVNLNPPVQPLMNYPLAGSFINGILTALHFG